MPPKENKMESPKEQALLTFLQLTKDGKYAKVDETALVYSRIRIQREEAYSDEDYLYSVS